MSPFTSFRRGQPHASSSAPRPVPGTSQTTTPLSVGHSMFGVHIPRFANDTSLSRMKTCVAVSLDMLRKATTIATEIDNPDLSAALSTLTKIIKKLQTINTTVEGVETLRGRVASLLASVEKLYQRRGNRELPDVMESRIEELSRSWGDIHERVAGIRVRGKLKRLLTDNQDAKALGGLVEELNNSIQDRIVKQGVLNIEQDAYDIPRDVKAIKASLQTTFMPIHAKMAPYNSNDVRRLCLEGTRVEFLRDIYTWIIAACDRGSATPEGGMVLWINGLRGTGKTTVARSVAEWCDLRGLLGGSFFCSRSDNECSDPNFVFLTLCRQLCEHHRPFMDQVQEVLRRHPDIVCAGPHRQFEQLILHPLEALESPFPRSVYVLDAVDELKDIGITSTILSIIAQYAPRIAKFLLFVITSRPEVGITALLEGKHGDSLQATTTPLLLRNIPIDIALRDIKLYIDHAFKDNAEILGAAPDWPSADEKDALAEQSQGWFMYIVTAIEFIMDRAHGNPKGRLNLLLSDQPDSSPHEFLSTLYSTIMVTSSERVSPALVNNICNVLGTILLAQEALSISAVSCLLCLSENSIRNALVRLRSVIHVPAESHQPICIIHPTLRDFLPQSITFESTEPASTPAALHLQPTVQHWYLFAWSIGTMSSALKRDMIEIRYPATFRNEIDNFKERVQSAVQPHVSYASRFWGVHLRDGIGAAATLDVFPLFCDFAHTQLLHWLETCSLLDALDRVTFTLDIARSVCQTLGGQFADLVPLLTDCHRFVLTYSPCIHAAPLQVYHAGVASTGSHIRTTYAHEFQHTLIVYHGVITEWSPHLDTVIGHGGRAVRTVAFSPDGSRFVTGGWDDKVTIWKTAIRDHVMSFDGHAGCVLCVAFSPDGLHVASGGNDRRVFLWKASSGQVIHTLGEHTGPVYSLMYSGDGRLIISATRAGEVNLWDTTDGRCRLNLSKTGKETFQVGISPDGGVIAHGYGTSLVLYDVSSATNETLECGDEVQACTFSPEGRYVAARSECFIRIWAWPSKTVLRSITVADNLTSRLAFSCDGTLIGCGSQDGSVRLWQVLSEDLPWVLQGHTDRISDLAYSPYTSQVISASWDGTIKVWDGTMSFIPTSEAATLERPSPPPTSYSSSFSLVASETTAVALLHLPTTADNIKPTALGSRGPDGALTVTHFSDTISAWDAALDSVDDGCLNASARAWSSLFGQQHTQLSWRPFAISLDHSLIACQSPSSSEVVNVYDFLRRTLVATLTGHTDYVLSIAISADKQHIATGSEDSTVKIWDVVNGTLICDHIDHHGGIRVTAFSPDGRLVASGSRDCTVRIFEVATKYLIRVLQPHRAEVVAAMFAADAIHLAAFDSKDWVYIWDITTGARVHEFSIRDHGHLRSLVISLDDTGILVGGEDGTQRTVSMWKSGTRSWPAYHITWDGWVYVMCPGKTRRLCWLPAEWRTHLCSDGTMCYLSGDKSACNAKQRVIRLNMSQIQSYVDTLDNSV